MGAIIFGGAAWRRLSIAGELIDSLARFIPDHDDRSGLPGPAIFQKLIYYFTSGPNGGLVARHHRTARIADYPIWVDQYEEIARHRPSICATTRKDKEPDRTAKLARLKLTIDGRLGWPTIGQLGMFAARQSKRGLAGLALQNEKALARRLRPGQFVLHKEFNGPTTRNP